MARVLVTAILMPLLAMLLWLAFGGRERRADFVVASDELRTIDPHRVSFMDEIQVANCLFEGLTRLNAMTLQPEPGVAKSWSVSADGREYEFRLRSDARWSNGDAVTAEHFRIAWLRVLNPAVESQYAPMLFVIEGAEAYYRASQTAAPLPAEHVGIQVIDPQTLRVRLRAACAFFLDLTSFPTMAPAHPASMERWAYRDGRVLPTRRLWTRPENLVCNGPFVLRRWDFKRRLLLEKNAVYWEAPAIAAQSIEIAISASPSAALLGFETGRIDLVRGVEPEVARVLRSQHESGARPEFHLGDRFSTFFLRVNCRREPFSENPALRRALSLAIDRDAMCRSVLGLGETPAYALVPPAAISAMPRVGTHGETIYYTPPAGLGARTTADGPRALAAAERLELAHANFVESGFDATSRPIRLAYASDPPQQKRVMEAIQAMWEQTLGVRVELEVMERKVLSQRIRQLDYDIVRSDWYGDYLDPTTFLELFMSDSGQNRTGWQDAVYDDQMRAAAVASDHAERFARLSAAERRLCEEQLPIIPLYFKTGNFLLNPRFAGFADNVRDVLQIQRATPCKLDSPTGYGVGQRARR